MLLNIFFTHILKLNAYREFSFLQEGFYSQHAIKFQANESSKRDLTGNLYTIQSTKLGRNTKYFFKKQKKYNRYDIEELSDVSRIDEDDDFTFTVFKNPEKEEYYFKADKDFCFFYDTDDKKYKTDRCVNLEKKKIIFKRLKEN